MGKSSGISIKAIVEKEEGRVRIRVERKAERIKKRFGFGIKRDDFLELSLEEVLCLSEYFKLDLFEGNRKVTLEELLPSFKNSLIFRRFVVLKDLIRRGYKAKSGPTPFDLSVWKKGKGPDKDPPLIRVKIYSENDFFSPFNILDLMKKCLAEKRELLIGVVDGDAEVSYYSVKIPDIRGSNFGVPSEKIKGIWTGEGVLITNKRENLEELGFGRKMGKFYHLSPEEAMYLKEKGVLEKDEIELGKEGEIRYKVYKDLRERGTIPKSGYKFGGTFRVYCLGIEEHSKFIVNPCDKEWKIKWCYLSSMVRTVKGVRKNLVFAFPLKEDIKYISVERIVP